MSASLQIPKTDLPRLHAFVASHGMVDPRIEGDAVVFGVETWNSSTGERGVEWETVRTAREARDALGY